MAAHNQLIAMALAIGGEKKSDSVVRADAAKTYRDFADELLLVAPQAGGKLRRALMKWATASTAVAHHIAERKPRAGLVIDFGPTEKQWDGAQTTAEKLCGQDLPALDQ
ncbi:hypothetical protein [Streptomyces sp. DH41]|uniref:hypothetical protein n=1 Tax=Streptomyces sp. DH41 TaxID=3040125 RepID=UPI00244151C9|nr:hypothetical protein [Streptomyces sp. DH41]MDG9728677.1 hypothetical protein [Streptomyces sp. DH41]